MDAIIEHCERAPRDGCRQQQDGSSRPTAAAVIGRKADGSTGTHSRRPPAYDSTSRLRLQELRDELRKGVRFTQRTDDATMHRSFESSELAGMAHPAWRMGGENQADHGDDMAFPGQDDGDEPVRDLEKRMQNGMRLRDFPVYANDDEDSEEIAAFLGLGISTSHEMSSAQDMQRAASFSGGLRSRMVPCSPPVPIPQTHWKRRNSMSGSTSPRSSSSSMLIPSHEHQYSRTQCEARLWDEYWNYKLSLESRESFEASGSNQRDSPDGSLPGRSVRTSSINQDQKPKPRTTSEASTDDTARDSGEELCADGDTVEADVFDMDDL